MSVVVATTPLRWLAVVGFAASGAAISVHAEPLPRVASINLCADQHVLAVADSEQILTVSWLAADPEDSLFAAEAARYPLNHGSAEELLRFDPDVVIAGTYTSPFTRALLARLAYRVVELVPEASIADIEHNVRTVATALAQTERGERIVAGVRSALATIDGQRPPRAPAAVVVRPGGFTVGAGSLAHELIERAGLRNVAAEQGLDRWGSLSMEALLRSAPDVIVLTGYRAAQPSLANAILAHPALDALAAERTTVTVRAAYWACGLPRSLESAATLQRAATP